MADGMRQEEIIRENYQEEIVRNKRIMKHKLIAKHKLYAKHKLIAKHKLSAKHFLWGLMILAIFFTGKNADAAAVPAKYRTKVSSDVLQLITVKYKGNSRGILTYYERKKGCAWKKKFRTAAWLGRKGIGKKKEGDRKTPTGVYTLDQAFGIKKNPGTDLPYTKVNRYCYWCSDSNSKYYNALVQSNKVSHKCEGEHLIDYKGSYDYAVSIGYNKKGKANKGSAIFLHCSSGRATAGCVAIPKKTLKKIIKRLRVSAKPKIIIYK